MKRMIYHIMIPGIMPVVFLMIAATPVEALGCRTRGWIALVTALISGLAGLGTAVMGAKRRMQGDPHSPWWVASSIILALPLIALLILA